MIRKIHEASIIKQSKKQYKEQKNYSKMKSLYQVKFIYLLQICYTHMHQHDGTLCRARHGIIQEKDPYNMEILVGPLETCSRTSKLAASLSAWFPRLSLAKLYQNWNVDLKFFKLNLEKQ
jgi:hypothetical protein